jgi:CBS domain-containing protein
MKLSAILKQKGGDVIAVSPNEPISEVIRVLAEKRIGAVLVRHGERLEGILSERDIVRSLAANGAATFGMAAAELMTRSPQVASPDTTVAEAMEMMTDGRFRHLPVLAHGGLIGLVSIGDVVKARISQQEMEVDSLRAYVAGGAH